MSAMTPTLWLILAIALALLAGSAYLYFKGKREAQTSCRTADMRSIDRQSKQLQGGTPAALQSKRARAGAPASYDVDRTNDRRVADLAAFRANLNQVEVTAAQHALLDMGRGVRRPNPYPMGSTGFVPYQIAYAKALMEREHQNADAEVSHA